MAPPTEPPIMAALLELLLDELPSPLLLPLPELDWPARTWVVNVVVDVTVSSAPT